jgi:hypothetical protein
LSPAARICAQWAPRGARNGTKRANGSDAGGRCAKQRVTFSGEPDADAYFYYASYLTEGDRVVQVDVRESGEPPMRYRFTTSGSLESETYNPGTTRAVAVAYDFHPISHFVSGVTVTWPDAGERLTHCRRRSIKGTRQRRG